MYWMSKLILLMFAVIVLNCCNSSYKKLNGQPHETGYGYSEELIPQGGFMIRYDGRVGDNYIALRALLIRRAGELCPGALEISQLQYNKGFVMHARKTTWPYVTAHLRCTAGIIDDSKLFDDITDESQ